MDSRFIRKDAIYDEYASRPVFRYRVVAHNLGQQGNELSENHLTLYLLIGSDECVRVDMIPNPDPHFMDMIGRLDLRGHKYSMPNSMIKYAEVDARGCPADFNPTAGRPARSPNSPSVQDIVSLLVQHGFHMFRFVNMDTKSVGCRFWILSALNLLMQARQLDRTADFGRTVLPQHSITELVEHRWGAGLPPVKIDLVPGLFLRGPSVTIDDEALCTRLQSAQTRPLVYLAYVLQERETEVDLVVMAENDLGAGPYERNATLEVFAEIANRRKFEASTAYDLMTLPIYEIESLRIVIERHYPLAYNALREAFLIRMSGAQGRWSDIFTYYLVAVCDMSGAPDSDLSDGGLTVE